MLELARELRKNETKVEKLLWFHLRNRRFHGLKFKRQFVIEPYIVDFACISHKVIIEADGSQHLENVEYDQIRTEHLNLLGYKVLRFWNNEILKNIELVLQSIFEQTLTRPFGPPSPKIVPLWA